MPAHSKKAFEQAAGANVHLIAQVKANQPALHHAIVALCDTAAPLDSNQTADKTRRCRGETRTVEVFASGASLADTEWDGHIRLASQPTISRWEKRTGSAHPASAGLCDDRAVVPGSVMASRRSTSLWTSDADSGHCVAVLLRPGKTPSGKEIRGHLRRLI